MTLKCLAVILPLAAALNAQTGSPGPLASSCGVTPPPASAGPSRGGRGLPVFPPGEYPVQLPAVSLLGARNDLPNPYSSGKAGDTCRREEYGARPQA